MSENIGKGETIEPGKHYTPPSDEETPSDKEIRDYFNELGRRGVTVEWECDKCGDPTEDTVLPEERDQPEPLKRTICMDCAESDLREAGLI